MCKIRIPKINSIHFGAIWIGISLIVGMVLPIIIWMVTAVFYWIACVIGGIVLLGFIIIFSIEMKQDLGKKPYYERYLCDDIPFDSERQTAVIKCSICTGEQIAGFKNKVDGQFTEVMLIKNSADLEKFKIIYGIIDVKKEY